MWYNREIDHNVSNNDTVIVVFALATTTNITGATLGSTYTIEIKAGNTGIWTNCSDRIGK